MMSLRLSCCLTAAAALVSLAGCSAARSVQAGLTDAASAATGRLEPGVDRPGSDYRSFRVESDVACREACRDESRCRAFTWTEAGGTSDGGVCSLKSNVPAPRPLAGATSGVVRP